MENLKRSDLAEKFCGYHIKNNIAHEKEARKYLNMVIKYLEERRYESNESYLLSGRKEFVYKEIMDIINGNITNHDPLYFVLGSLQEFMCDENIIFSSNDNYIKSRKLNDKYNKSGIICSEEKEDIIKIIDKILNYICICPICNNRLNFLMDGQTYNCSKCNKYFKLNSDYDFEENDYPYNDKNVDY